MGHDEEAFLANLREENRAFYDTELGRAALKDLNKLFPRHWLYVAELLQNALDAGATQIAFELGAPGSVIVEHNGQAFSAADVRALCVKGGSTKGVGTIGFMGVGFKSIYLAFETVEVSSGLWRFRLNVPITRGRFDNKSRRWVGAMLPDYDETIVSPSTGMTCRFALSRRVDGLGRIEDDFRNVTGEDDALVALLARRGVQRLALAGRRWELGSNPEAESPSRARFRLTVRSLSDRSTTDWMLFSRTYTPSRSAVKRLLEHRDVDPRPEDEDRVYAEATRPRTVEAFFRLDREGTPRLPDRGGLFALLPTSISVPFGVHLQADWLLAITRQDLMDVTDNPWHEEIRSQLPTLVRDYLEWMTGTRAPRDASSKLYGIFPAKQDNEIDRWFTARRLMDATAKEIAAVPFLPPVRDSDDDTSVAWIAPSQARQLPEQLAGHIDHPASRPRLLFGDNVVSRRTLGSRAMGFLRDVGLSTEMSPRELAALWDGGVFRTWWEGFPATQRTAALEQLYCGLSELDQFSPWRAAQLACVPTEAGAIATRAAARRYPAEWSLLANEPEIASLLSRGLGPRETRFPFDIDRAWTQAQSKALPFLKAIAAPLVDALVTEWWNCLPQVQDEAGIGAIVRFTDWVRTKQPQRKKAIPYLLCDTPNGVELLPCDKALLGEPYTNGMRHLLFPDLPTVSPQYERQTAGSAGEWRLFLLTLDAKPQGEFVLWLTNEEFAPENVNGELTAPIAVPQVRQRPRMKFDAFGYWRVPYAHVALVDAHLADAVLEQVAEVRAGAAFVSYLSEGTEKLRKWPRRVARYVADVTEAVTDVQTDPAKWVEQLTELAWVPVRGYERLFRPPEVLTKADEARPSAPVASIPEPLLQVLLAAKVPFGRELADAPVLERLRVHGPTATTEDLQAWLGEAIQATRENPDLVAATRSALELPLFPLPDGFETIDARRRIPYGRFVKKSRPRSDLGGWIVPMDRLPEGSELHSLLAQLETSMGLPDTTTLEQTVDFLRWVYAGRPDAERVRQVLPIAYNYVEEDGTDAEWEALRREAHVFVQRSREWTRSDSVEVYLDDLRDPVLEPETRALRLATPGHLGETGTDRQRVAERLGIALVSQRFRVEAAFIGADDAPQAWKDGFASIVGWLARQQADHTDEEEHIQHADSDAAAPLGLKLVRHRKLRLTVFDNGIPSRTAEARVLADEHRVGVTGEPWDFAEELAEVLIHKSELSRRRDAVRLTTRCMGHLLLLDDPAALARRLTGGSVKHELQHASGGADNAPAGSDAGPGSDQETISDDGATSASQDWQAAPGFTLEGEATVDGASGDFCSPIDASSFSVDDGHQLTMKQPVAKQPTFTEDSLAAITRSMFLRLVPGDHPEHSSDNGDSGSNESDETPYREAVLQWEVQCGRFPVAKSGTQPGHDVDSFTHEEGHPDRRLIRRIEVKGKGVMWLDQEVVTPSMRQFLDAAQLRVEEHIPRHPAFDYWLYVVETNAYGERQVLPIRNPARAGKVAVRADLWRKLVEVGGRAATGDAEFEDRPEPAAPSTTGNLGSTEGT